MLFFRELGSLIETRWRNSNYDQSAFPQIAADALTQVESHRNTSPWDVLPWIYSAVDIPRQMDLGSEFGNPPVTVFSGHRFYIDLYFWLDATTSTHQHGFCGAFQVLQGSSIHSRYSFSDQRQLSDHFLVGSTRLESVELLGIGDVRQIIPGNQYIHSLFHLDRPSVSLCVRTYHSNTGTPQYNYRRPHFAIDPFLNDPRLVKQVQCAQLLLRMQDPETEELLGQFLAHADFHTSVSILEVVGDYAADDGLERSFGVSCRKDLFGRLLGIVRERHAELSDLIPVVFEETRRQHYLSVRRAQITGNEHRFLLALLLNVPERTRLLELMSIRFPDSDPVEMVLELVDELARTKVQGSSEANVLGISDYDDDYLEVLESMLQGSTLDDLRKNLCSSNPAGLSREPEAIYASIRNSIVFKSIFSI